jgi:glycerol-3-phosphate acyltransferase PlsY
LGVETPGNSLLQLRVLSGVCAIIGHNWTCFLGFKGGKGVATSLGFLLGLVPLGALLALGVWVVVVLLTRYVSLGSIIAAAALGVSIWFLPFYSGHPAWFHGVISALALLAIIKHHANIRRLLNGTENRFR